MIIPKPAAAVVLVLLASLSGCGTLLGLASEREVFVVTNPSGALLMKNGIPDGASVSPTAVHLDPAEEWRIDARLDDLKGGTQVTRHRRIGVVIADLVFTAGLGLWIDYLTGAMFYFPDRVILNLGRSHAGGPVTGGPAVGAPDPQDQDPVAADPAWPGPRTGGPPPRREAEPAEAASTGGESSTRNLLGTTKQR